MMIIVEVPPSIQAAPNQLVACFCLSPPQFVGSGGVITLGMCHDFISHYNHVRIFKPFHVTTAASSKEGTKRPALGGLSVGCNKMTI